LKKVNVNYTQHQIFSDDLLFYYYYYSSSFPFEAFEALQNETLAINPKLPSKSCDY